MMHGWANVELGLHVHDVTETEVNALRLEKKSWKEVVGMKCWSPQVRKICTSFQNWLQLLIGSKTMDDGKHHHTCLDDAKALKKVDAVSRGEGSQKVDDKNHRLKNLKMGLKHFVLKLSPEARS